MTEESCSRAASCPTGNGSRVQERECRAGLKKENHLWTQMFWHLDMGTALVVTIVPTRPTLQGASVFDSRGITSECVSLKRPICNSWTLLCKQLSFALYAQKHCSKQILLFWFKLERPRTQKAWGELICQNWYKIIVALREPTQRNWPL